MTKWKWQKLPVGEDGTAYPSLEAFQAAEIAKLLKIANKDDIGLIRGIVEHKSEIVEILELTTDARPSARGVPKKRKSKTEPAQGELPKVA